MNKNRQIFKYLIFDIISSLVAWILFFAFRKIYIESAKFGYEIPIEFKKNYFYFLIAIPCFWLILYYLNGYYKRIYRKSRLKELWQTISISMTGVIIIFFLLILDDTIVSYKDYYYSFFALFSFHFILTYIPRFLITNHTIKKLRYRKIGFNTLLIGNGKKAFKIYNEFKNQEQSSGNKFIGFININKTNKFIFKENLKHLGEICNLQKIIEEYKIEEIIIAIENSEHKNISDILNKLYKNDLIIKVIPSMYDILTGTANMTTFFTTPLIEISYDLMSTFQENLKKIIDIVFSIIALILLIPLYIFLMISVKLSSKGPIFYGQERIGKYGKPFFIWKFRSMFIDAEKHGPALSKDKDIRITKFGLFMRKLRLDETPQFYNVLIGDMSLVGPRPERQFFIEKIAKIAPHYYHLQKVKPGITSWGQVKYGYAENVKEMVERLKYDIIYIENMSIYTDFKIMIYTVMIIFKGSGK
ncbi:MAG: hypothetical protein B6I24_00635 [Bacteroidetes bacterium 4572_128]|nr:MAG: hypothetical protein B6I24_00635 [Bacteroidetes bacterium 4572_128]